MKPNAPRQRLEKLVRCLGGGLGVIAISLSSAGCERREERTPGQMLVGRWETSSTNSRFGELPGDGSYVEFDACGSGPCTGSDYLAANKSTGRLRWRLDSDGRTLTIEDATPAGGYYNGTWQVENLSEEKLRITITSQKLGSATVEMKKVR